LLNLLVVVVEEIPMLRLVFFWLNFIGDYC
jgi:hypothetical protein